ncbi:MAG: ribonuclease J [Chloroflexi bacterium]|nr:ribonuclease J [Chloroflexota bacterium]
MEEHSVRIIPLGGVGEVGKNLTVIECGDDIVIVDMGLMFPEEHLLGIDLVIPDISYLRQRREKIRGLVVTHGHEDHIGAIPFLWPDLQVPIYATRLTHGLIRTKLQEHKLARMAQQVEFQPGEVVQLGRMTVEPFRVNHSIPDAVGLAISTPAGLIVHTGDFKFDPSPVDGRPTDFAKLGELGARGVLCLVSDCVRVESPGHTPSERVVGETFRRIFAQAPGRIIVTTFASNISRVQQVIETAWEYDRKVAVVGRSMEANVGVAIELGYLDAPEGVLVPLAEAQRLPHNRVVLVTTGSQGEPSSVLSRIASNDHRQIRVEPGDTVIVSATPVPGNEETVARTISNLFKLGADVIYQALDQVHVSGHASQEELKLMLNLVRPRYCIPFHGDFRHMVLYSRLAAGLGVPEANILLPDVGTVVELGPEGAKMDEAVSAGSVLVDGLTVGEIEEVVLRDRHQLSRDGIVMISVVVDRQTGQLVADPVIVSRGFLYAGDLGVLVEQAKEAVIRTIEGERAVGVEYGFLVHKLREVMSRFFHERTRQRPMILPIITEI